MTTESTARIHFLRSKVDSIEQDLKEFQQQIFKVYSSKQDDIVSWAEYIDELRELGQFNIAQDDISTYIRNRVQELGIDIPLNYISKILPSKYKKNYRAENAKKNEYIYEDKSVTEQTVLDKPASMMSNDEIRNAVERAQEMESEYQRRRTDMRQKKEELARTAQLRGIAVDIKTVKQVVSTPKDPQESASHIAFKELLEVMEGIEQKLYEFPPSKADDIALCKVIEDMIAFLKPLQDEKFTKSLLEWFKVEQDYIDWGKHAAGSNNASITIKGDKRKLTREQVGDRFKEIMQIACTISNESMPDISDGQKCWEILEKAKGKGLLNDLVREFSRWHKNSVEPCIAQRKVWLHDKLSESAFGSSETS